VLRIVAVDQPNMQGQAASLGELVQETRDEIRAETPDPGFRQVDVGDDERSPGRLEHDVRERVVRGCNGGSVATHAVVHERLPQRLPERLARSGDLCLAGLRRELELDVERAVAGDEPEQVIEHG
jgi:hypothetical protein